MKIEAVVKQKKFPNPQSKALINIFFTSNFLMDKTDELMKSFDLTHAQYNVLRILKGRYPASAMCSSVKEVMLDKNPDLTRLCDRLIKKDLIVRDTNAENRRQVMLRITENGLKLLQDIEPHLKENTSYLQNLTDQEAETLSGLLDKLRG